MTEKLIRSDVAMVILCV